MMTPGLIERLRKRTAAARGMTVEEFRSYERGRMAALNGQLNSQMKSQQMTPEILNKRCTL